MNGHSPALARMGGQPPRALVRGSKSHTGGTCGISDGNSLHLSHALSSLFPECSMSAFSQVCISVLYILHGFLSYVRRVG